MPPRAYARRFGRQGGINRMGMGFVHVNWNENKQIAADLVHAYYRGDLKKKVDVAREFRKRTGYRLAPDTIFKHSGVE